jgi:hypothetical protein
MTIKGEPDQSKMGLAALLRQSLAQAPGQAGNAQDGGEMTEQ